MATWSKRVIEQMEDMPAGTLGFRALGKVTGQDYERVLVPDVEAVFALNRTLQLLYQFGPQFEGFELEALWDEAKLGLRHLNSWDRIAVVTDVGWVRAMVEAAGFMAPAETRLFHNADLAAAKAWIAELGA